MIEKDEPPIVLCWESGRMWVSSEWAMWLLARSSQCGLACHSKSGSLHNTSEEGNSRMLRTRPWIQTNSFKAKAKIKRLLWLFVFHRFQPSHFVIWHLQFQFSLISNSFYFLWRDPFGSLRKSTGPFSGWYFFKKAYTEFQRKKYILKYLYQTIMKTNCGSNKCGSLLFLVPKYNRFLTFLK